MPILSVAIPAYNEGAFTGTLLDKIAAVPTERPGLKNEIIVVNDVSSDNTERIARSRSGVRCFTRAPNQGKGKAVQRGVRDAAGDNILIQDADLEYAPNDFLVMLAALAAKRADVVRGSRTPRRCASHSRRTLFPGKHADQGTGPWLAGVLLTLRTALIHGQWITDTRTDHEITAKLRRPGKTIVEVPIACYPRSREEGKKIKPSDGLIAVWTLLRFRFTD
jgi:dolichol-phosphate mannosyltransferase